MKNIENLGSWIIDHWINLAVLILAFSAITLALNAHKSVILNEKEFRCAESSPDGLGTRCDVYVRRVK
jgi:hypothetical protein